MTHLKNTLALFFKDPAIYPGYTGINISELTLNYLGCRRGGAWGSLKDYFYVIRVKWIEGHVDFQRLKVDC